MMRQFPGSTNPFERRALHNGVAFPFQSRMLEQLVDLVNDPHANVGRLSALIGWNPLFARMIALRASDCCDMPGKVSNVHLATALLESSTLRDTLKHAVASGANRHITYSFHYCEELWHHSLACALVAKVLAVDTGRANPQKAFLAGLVHDVGFLFLGSELPSAEALHTSPWDPVTDLGKFRAYTPPAMHEEAGSWMVKRWETIPADVLAAVRHHHAPSHAGEHRELAAVIHVADTLCHHTFGGPMGKTAPVFQLDPQALAILGTETSGRSPQETMKELTLRIRHAAPALQLKVRVLQQRLFETFEELPEQERFLLALHYYEGISFRSIAGILGTSQEDVARHHAIAFERFLKVLAEVGEVL
jgi:RNA polymerase sigma factor (sigma-70 family)